jgi:RNA polymerase sigma factor (sigma-70 family)
MEISATKKADDIELINKAKSGDQQAFAALMAKYRNAVFFTILKMIHNRDDAEDILLVSFSKAFHNLENYKEDFAFSTWLFKIATNNCIDFIRKKKLLTTPLEGSVSDSDESEYRGVVVSDTNADPEESIIKEQKAAKMRAIVDQLPDKYQTLIKMRYFEELSYEEIATKTDLPLGTVKAQLFRAKEALFQKYNPSKDKY